MMHITVMKTHLDLSTMAVPLILFTQFIMQSDGTDPTLKTDFEGGWPVEEYCTGETFRPRCPGGKNDVIIMTTARFGRMNFGRCLEEEPELASIMQNPRFFGCSADVKSVIDRLCSGRSECDVRINDQNFEGIKPCYAHLKMYLEASYICIKVAAASRHCTVSLTTEPQHVIGGGGRSVEDSGSCGSETHPWSIEALAGQRIAVSLIDFGRYQPAERNEATVHNNESQHTGCHPVYGYVIDRISRRNVTVCGGQSSDVKRKQVAHGSSQTTLFTSTSNQLHFVAKEEADHKFIIRFEAVGCSDLAPPSDAAWLKRVDDQITVGCYMSRQSWQLNCVNGVWTGTVGVCSHIGNEETQDEAERHQRLDGGATEQHASTEIAALAAVASAGLAVCCLVICIGILCLRRQRGQVAKKNRGMNHDNGVKNYNEINRLNAECLANVAA